MGTELSTADKAELARLEGIISRNKDAWVETTMAMIVIRENEWYHPYDTFTEYCVKKWGFDRHYARRLITASEVIQTVPIGTVENEWQARSLSKVPAAQRAEIVQEAKKHAPDGKLTAKAIATVFDLKQAVGALSETDQAKFHQWIADRGGIVDAAEQRGKVNELASAKARAVKAEDRAQELAIKIKQMEKNIRDLEAVAGNREEAERTKEKFAALKREQKDILKEMDQASDVLTRMRKMRDYFRENAAWIPLVKMSPTMKGTLKNEWAQLSEPIRNFLDLMEGELK